MVFLLYHISFCKEGEINQM